MAMYDYVVEQLGKEVRDAVDGKVLKPSEAKAKSDALAADVVSGATDDEVLIILRQASQRPMTRKVPTPIPVSQPLGALMRAVASAALAADTYDWWRSNR